MQKLFIVFSIRKVKIIKKVVFHLGFEGWVRIGYRGVIRRNIQAKAWTPSQYCLRMTETSCL